MEEYNTDNLLPWASIGLHQQLHKLCQFFRNIIFTNFRENFSDVLIQTLNADPMYSAYKCRYTYLASTYIDAKLFLVETHLLYYGDFLPWKGN